MTIDLNREDDFADADQQPEPPARFFWPVLLGLILDAIPAALAWWMWQLHGWFPDAVFVLCVIGGVIWTLGVLGTFLGYGRIMADDDPDDGEDEL